ncbi:hypothetical protein D3C85_593430 [compost metagenome]|jgi:uncharacterized membrane protein
MHSVLFLFVVFMGIVQGFSMIAGSTEVIKMFENFNFNKTEILLFGITTLMSSILIFNPKTFLIGNFLLAVTILLLTLLQIQNQNLKEAFVEMPFLLMNLILVYLKHPFKTKILIQ